MRAVVNRVPAMLAFWDTEQRCRFANAAYERWFGVTPQALLGKTLKDLLGPIYPLNLPYIEGALRGEPQHFEREIPDPHGGPPRYSQADYIPHIVDGQVRGFAVLVTDITRRKQMEEELRAANERLTTLNQELITAAKNVQMLAGLLPICAWCKKVRNDDGYYQQIEAFLSERTHATFTHGICPDCARQALRGIPSSGTSG